MFIKSWLKHIFLLRSYYVVTEHKFSRAVVVSQKKSSRWTKRFDDETQIRLDLPWQKYADFKIDHKFFSKYIQIFACYISSKWVLMLKELQSNPINLFLTRLFLWGYWISELNQRYILATTKEAFTQKKTNWSFCT